MAGRRSEFSVPARLRALIRCKSAGSTFGANSQVGTQKGCSSMNTQKTPRFHHRLGLNQPAHSPTARAMAEMAAAIERECGGEYRLEVFPESQLGPDPQMFADVQTGAIELFVSGAGLSGIAPSSA